VTLEHVAVPPVADLPIIGRQPFTVIAAPQRSPEWFAARLGRLTGSRVSDMLATIKSGESAGRRNLRTQLVLERVTGRQQGPDFLSPAMQQGIDREPAAYAAYEVLRGELLARTGFLSHDALPVGCSLDGHVGDFLGVIEIKSPTPSVHLEYLKTGIVPGEYYKQIVHALWMTGAQWCDWLSYNPDFPGGLHVKLVRVARRDDEIALYDLAVAKFLAEVDAEVAVVRGMGDSWAV
jgi:hypothetical protein